MKKNQKGFTLIELLAVIVILAIIALIATPIIVGVINDAKKNAFKDTAYGIIEAGKLYYASQFDNDAFAGKTFDFAGNVEELKLSGEKPAGGSFVISANGKYAMAVYNKDKSLCVIKEYDKEEIKVSSYKKEDCIVPGELGSGVQILVDKNTKENNEGLYTDDFGNTRYRGASPKNYVTFSDEVWRIIGVFNGKLKIVRNERIKNTEDASHVDTFLWSSQNENDWHTASLQTYLNGTYYSTLNTTSQNMIAEEKYNLGGIKSDVISRKETYELERRTTVYEGRPTEWVGKIGLMYLSDYEYATQEDCALLESNYANSLCKDNNWLFTNNYVWTLTPLSTSSSYAVYIGNNGAIHSYHVGKDWRTIYPVLYLKSNTKITAGDGTSSNPYLLQ